MSKEANVDGVGLIIFTVALALLGVAVVVVGAISDWIDRYREK